MLSVGVGGYMEQWIGMSSTDDANDKMNDGGMAQRSDSEIYITARSNPTAASSSPSSSSSRAGTTPTAAPAVMTKRA